MNQALEDLKNDIQSLIDATSDTINSLVDELSSRSFDIPQSATSGSDGSEFTSQIEELRSKVRAATDNLKQQAKEALQGVRSSQGSSLGSQSGVGSAGGISGGYPSASGGGSVTGGTPSAEPKPGAASGVNEGTAASNNVDDQYPAGGSAQAPNVRPGDPATTIGPDSFKSGA